MSALRSRMADLSTYCWPVDANAMREMRVSRGGWEDVTSFECPKLCAVSPAEVKRRHGSKFRDLTGMRRGRMTVVGLEHWEDEGRSRWVVRCDCGRYELRRHGNFWRGIRKGTADACHVCMPREQA